MITAVVLAAGESKRMGQPKMLLPWGEMTVIGKVITTLQGAGVEAILVVTGGLHDQLGEVIDKSIVRVKNEEFSNGEMLTSVKVGLRNIGPQVEAALIVLGDQPQIEEEVVRGILSRFDSTHHPIIVPSYQMHRGHPWLVHKSHWREINQLRSPDTLKEFLNTHHDQIDYIQVDTPSVLQDVDTEADYSQFKP